MSLSQTLQGFFLHVPPSSISVHTRRLFDGNGSLHKTCTVVYQHSIYMYSSVQITICPYILLREVVDNLVVTDVE